MLHLPPLTILVVDDEILIGRVLERLFGPPHQVVTATTVEEAIPLLNQYSFDVVLSDLHLSEQSGLALLAHLTAHHADLATRLLFLTGGITDDDTAARLRSLDNPVLCKPFDIPDLVAEIEALLPD